MITRKLKTKPKTASLLPRSLPSDFPILANATRVRMIPNIPARKKPPRPVTTDTRTSQENMIINATRYKGTRRLPATASRLVLPRRREDDCCPNLDPQCGQVVLVPGTFSSQLGQVSISFTSSIENRPAVHSSQSGFDPCPSSSSRRANASVMGVSFTPVRGPPPRLLARMSRRLPRA